MEGIGRTTFLFIGEKMMSGLDLGFARILSFWFGYFFCEMDIVSEGAFVFRLSVLI